jgi:hypothetical protein
MGNKFHSKQSADHHDRPNDRQGGNGAKSMIGAPMHQQSAEQHRFGTRDERPSEVHETSAGRPQPDREPTSVAAEPDSERSFMDSVLQSIKDNPIPIALVAAGLGVGAGATWLIMSNRRRQTSPVSQLVHRVLRQAGSRSRELEQSIEELIPSSPIAIGAAVLTVAAGITLAVLGTRKPSSWLDKRREQFTELAQGLVHDAVEKVEAVARQVSEAL